MEGNTRRVIVLGEQSLLVQCGELLIEKGFELAAIVTANSVVSDWSDQRQIAVYDSYQALKSVFEPGSLEVVFSITNLQVLPAWVLALGAQAINFHDGPLPKYAGLNAPVWAIINNEVEHGVTWHEMTADVDEGRILSQASFPIVPGETALSINAKCYQAGVDSFSDLLNGLVSGQLNPVTQALESRSYFGLSKRPAGAGLIDWGDSVETIERTVRALDYGTYRNPLVSSKFEAGEQLFIVRSAVIVERDNSQQSAWKAGEIVAVDSNSLRIACGDGLLELSEIYSLKGERVACLEAFSLDFNTSVGALLRSIDAPQREEIHKHLESVCRYEEKWIEYFLNAEAVCLPYANEGPVSGNANGWQTRDIALPANVLSSAAFLDNPQAFVLSLFVVLLARLNSKNDFTLAVDRGKTDEFAKLFERYLPFPIELDDQKPFTSVMHECQNGLNDLARMGDVASDLWAREPLLASHGSLDDFSVKLDLLGSQSAETLSGDSHSELYLSLPVTGDALLIHFNNAKVSTSSIEQLLDQLNVVVTEVSAEPEKPIAEISILSKQDLASFAAWNESGQRYDSEHCLHHLIELQAKERPDKPALAFEDASVNYQTLNERANKLARLLLDRGVSAGDLVGVMMDRSIDMIVALVAIHKAGCAYVPLDPVYPADRLCYMVEDSNLRVLLTESRHKTKLTGQDVQVIAHDEMTSAIAGLSGENLNQAVLSEQLAYVIYTSGSTGKPKGVMVEHRNVANFFAGMDGCIGVEPGVWLAVTSISFDISVLEIFWTLARGFEVVIYSDRSVYETPQSVATPQLSKEVDFSLFYWNVADEESHHLPDKYQLLLDGAKFADQNGFKAVWNPERHFASFGGLFPNPSVTCAALATITKNIDLRAGSCVIPLHSPIRVAEEWAVVDNLSNGRVGIAVASGWAPPDFAIKPENFSDSKNIMFESLDKVRRLWRGEKVSFPGPDGDVEVRTLPRPIQKELPYWVTTAGNVETFKSAGKAGANVLTHLLGQTFDEVHEKVLAYRQAWEEAGHAGQGTITLMLHTLIGGDLDEVKNIVRQPMKNYLKSAMFLVKGAAWNFPTFKKMSEETGKSLDEFFESISDEDMDDLLEFAFQRYFSTSGLFGTPDSAIETIAKCAEVGVDEVACLIDYGIDTELVMKQLPYLNQLKQNCNASLESKPANEHRKTTGGYTIPELIERHQVTHFQCTPSMATMLVSDPVSKNSLKQIKHMMVGGEAMPAPLASSLKASISGRLTNMYGPTETTIWSSTSDIESTDAISIGRPIANTQMYIVDHNLNALPAGVPGELVIAGDGVVRGYHDRPELTQERFVDGWKLTGGSPAQRIYRTGDLARFESDGRLMCLGRIDHQVKIRGYRIELGEIESLLQCHDSVRECAVILREDNDGDKRLVAYVRPQYDSHVDADALKKHLATQLPDFMVPSFYVEMAVMPLTPNGKLDRNALPEPIQQQHKNSGEFSLPENEWENLVAEVWMRALGVPEVGRKDNFFDIGGHSLLVIQVLKELRENEKISKSLQMTDLFRHTTVEALAKFIAADSDGPDTKGSEVASSRVAARKAAMNRRRRR